MNELEGFNRVQCIKLLSYTVILESQIYQNRKSEYYSLFEDYLNSKIEANFLRYVIFQLDRKNIKVLDSLKEDLEQVSTFSIDSRSKQFLDLIVLVFGYCETLNLDSDPKVDDSFRMNEDQYQPEIF